MESTNERTYAVGTCRNLFLIFLVLKLTGLIDWSWWWVTSPLWLGLAVIVCSGLLVLCGWSLFTGLSKILKR